MDPIYRVQRRDPASEPVTRVERPRLLTPAEREEARREREKRRKEKERQAPAKDRPSGADHYG